MVTTIPQERTWPTQGADSVNSSGTVQQAKSVPIRDFREVNKHVDAFMIDADISSQKLRE